MRAVCRGAGARAGRRRGQLLRAWRALAAGDASDQPDPCGARCRGCDPQPVRGAERCGAVAAAVVGGAGAACAALVAGPRPAEIPLSYAQRRLWFLERLEDRSGGSQSGGSSRSRRPWQHPGRRRHLCDPACGAACRGGSIVRRCRTRCAIWSSGTRACARCSRSISGCRGNRSWSRRRRGCGLRWRPRMRPALRRRSRRRWVGASICRVSCRCGRICSSSAPKSTCCFCCCITSPATAGRSVRCRGTWRRSTGRGATGWRRRFRRCRCSMPTTRCGSRRCWGPRTMPRA